MNLTPTPPKLTARPAFSGWTAAILFIAGLLGCLTTSRAGAASSENGLRLLQAELPAKVTLLGADCEQLAVAVGKATLAHQPDAPAILRVALTRGLKPLRRNEGKLPCACAKHLLTVSVAAAPTQASALLDLATELYPGCAGELAGALRDYDQVAFDDKAVVDDKNGPARNAAGSADPSAARRSGIDPAAMGQDASDDSARATQDPGDLSPHDIAGLGLGEASGFNIGFGAGFPGAPGFEGSTPSGGVALPPSPVTVAVNG